MIFVHYQLASSVGMSDKPYHYFKGKKLYGPDTINGHYQPRDWEPAQCIGEASANPCHNNWMTHLAKPWVGMIAGAMEQLGVEWL